MHALKVCVFCGSRTGSDPAYVEAARAIGPELARRNMSLVFGGGGRGLMGEVARGALSCGVQVTGIIPTFLISQENPVDALTDLIVVKDMHERKARMAEEADVFLVLPGGIGTLEEASEMLTGNWLGLYHKPIGFLDIDGFYEHLFRFFATASDAGFMPKPCFDRAIRDADVGVILDKLASAKRSAPGALNADCF